MRRVFDGARTRLSLIFGGRSAEERMDEELAFHIEMEAERIARDQGVSPDEARRLARAAFGGVTQHKETLRAGRGLAWLDTLSLDVRLAVRMLRKTPGLTVVAVLAMSLAVAIGCVCFSAVSRIVDAGLPVSEGDRVIGIRNIDTRQATDARATHLHYLPLWRGAMKSVEDLGAYRSLNRTIVTADGWSESAHVAEMSASGFRVTRVPPIVGRYLIDADERPDAPPVAVIGNRVWQQRYAGRADIVGQTIQVGDARHTIVGVMPDGYAFPVNNRIWIPLRLEPAQYERFRAPNVDVFARLVPGATLDDAQREAELVGKRLTASDPRLNADLHARVIPYTRMFIDNADSTWVYHLVQLVVAGLLAVIGTNVAVLVYARTASRIGEIAVRTALGASRARIISQLFAEAFALSLVAAVVGIAVAWVALLQIDAGLQRLAGENIPYWLQFKLTPGVVVYAIGLAAVSAVVIGVVPALKITGGKFRATLSELSGGGSGLRLGRPWTIMIVAQVAVAVALVPFSIMGIDASSKGAAASSLMAGREILTASISLDRAEATMDSSEAAIRTLTLRRQLVGRLESDARVGTVFLMSRALGDEDKRRFDPEPSGQVATERVEVSASELSVQPEYFRSMGIPFMAGRSFQSADLVPSANVAVVNHAFMQKMFGGRAAIGARVRVRMPRRPGSDTVAPPPWLTIVGVVSDFPVDSTVAAPRLYRPLAADVAGPVVIAVKMNGASATEFIPALRQHALATSPLLRLDGVRTMSQAFYDSFAEVRFAVLVMELITLSVTLLSAAGIYALMAFTITRRRREIGIRAALGAVPRRLLAAELARVMRQIAIGIVIGLTVAAAAYRGMRGDWGGQRTMESLVIVAVLMLAIGILSALRPAIGALRIQPTEALRSQ
jgi:predicted permease